MDFYSATLGLSIVAAIAALGLAMLVWFRLRRVGGPRLASGGPGRAVRWMGIVAIVLAGLSSVYHFLEDHRSGSSPVLGPAAFVQEHPAFSMVGGLAVAALVVLRIARPGADGAVQPERRAHKGDVP